MTNSIFLNSENSETSSDELSFELVNNADNRNSDSNTQSPIKGFIPEHKSSKMFQTEQEISNKGPWTAKEDKLLLEWIKKKGAIDWHECANFIRGRTGKQCREHWKNCLNPEVKKGEWTSEEDLLIMLSYTKYKGSWREMIHLFKERTENSIKNRFFSQLRKIASNDGFNNEKKRSSKFNLDYLLKYLEQGIRMAKLNYMRKNKMSQEEFKKYLNQLELKMKKNRNRKNKNILEKNLKSSGINLIGKKREKKSCEKIPESNIKTNNISNTNNNDINNNTNEKKIEIKKEEIKNENNNNEKQENIIINNDTEMNVIDNDELNINQKPEFNDFDSNKETQIDYTPTFPLFETEATAKNNCFNFFNDYWEEEDQLMFKRTDSDTIAKIISDQFSPNLEDDISIFGER